MRPSKEQKYLPRNIQFAISAAQQAADDAKLSTLPSESKTRAVCASFISVGQVGSAQGVAIGTGISGIEDLLRAHDTYNTRVRGGDLVASDVLMYRRDTAA